MSRSASKLLILAADDFEDSELLYPLHRLAEEEIAVVVAGVDWVDEAAVVDGNLISARTPADLGPWMKALLAALNESGR